MADKTLELALRIVAQATGKKDINALVEELQRVGHESDEAQPKANALSKELDELANQQDLVNAFKRSRNALEEQELTVTAAALALQDLQKQAKNTDKPFVQLAKSIDAAEKDLKQMRQELGQQSSHHKKLQTQLEKSGINSKNLKVAQRNLGAQFDKTGKEIDQYARKLSKGNAAAQRSASGLKSVVGQVTAVAAAYIGLDRVAEAVKDVFTTGDKFERLGIQFNALMGSFEGGQQATDWVKEFTKKTPLQLEQVSKAFVKLKAFGLDPMDGTMQAITDQAFKLGGSFQEVEGISLALGQAWAKQKLQGEEILQLVERGVPVWDLLEKATGKNTLELQKLSTAGKLGRDVIKQLIDEMGKGATGAAVANMALLSGQISNAKDNIAEFYNLVSTSGAMDWLKGQISDLNLEFAAMAKDGRLKEWAKTFSDAIISIGEGVKSTGKFLYEYRDTILTVGTAWATMKVGSFFLDMAKGTQQAIKWLVKLQAAQTAASIAGVKLDGSLKSNAALLGKLGLAGAAAFSVVEIYKLGDAIYELIKAENALEQSRKISAATEDRKNQQLKEISQATGVLIQNMSELHKAEQDGLIVYDLKAKVYRAASYEISKQNEQIKAQEAATKAASIAAKDHAKNTKAIIAPLKLTTEQALKYTVTLTEQAKSLDGVKAGVGGFIKGIDASIEAFKKSGAQYDIQIKQLEALKKLYQDHQVHLDATAKGTVALEQAYKDLGITSSTSLETAATKSKAAFELIRDNKEPVEQIRDAFIKYAQAAIVAAEAAGRTVPENLKAQAAALQLGDEYQKLTDKTKQYGDTAKNNQSLQQQLQADIDGTIAALGRNRTELNKTTEANDFNSSAVTKLERNQAKLTAQTKLLNSVKDLEKANLDQLNERYVITSNELERLEKAYANNLIKEEEYNRQKERLNQVLQLLQQSIDGLASSEGAAQQEVEKTTNSLIEQREEMERLEKQTGKSLQYTSLYAQAHQELNKTIDASSKSNQELENRIDELTDKIAQNADVISIWWSDLAQLNNQAFLREKQILSETLAVRNYTDELESSGITLGRINQITREANSSTSRLGNENLSVLQSAIDSARNKILSLRDDVNGTLSSLQDELDQLNNNQNAIEKRRYQQQQAELDAKLEAATISGDRASIDSAKQALALSEKIYNIKQKQITAESKQRQQQDRERATREQSQSVASRRTQPQATPNYVPTANRSTSNQPSQTIRLELVLPSGAVIPTDIVDQFKQLFLNELEQIKASS